MRLIDADDAREELIATLRDCFNVTYEVVDVVATTINNIPTIDAEPHWIPVTEKLPEVGESVLICDAYGDICIGHRTRSGYYFPDFCEDKIKDVRAWAELPEPYRGVKDGDD